jgi:hypothetical protein
MWSAAALLPLFLRFATFFATPLFPVTRPHPWRSSISRFHLFPTDLQIEPVRILDMETVIRVRSRAKSAAL